MSHHSDMEYGQCLVKFWYYPIFEKFICCKECNSFLIEGVDEECGWFVIHIRDLDFDKLRCFVCGEILPVSWTFDWVSFHGSVYKVFQLFLFLQIASLHVQSLLG